MEEEKTTSESQTFRPKQQLKIPFYTGKKNPKFAIGFALIGILIMITVLGANKAPAQTKPDSLDSIPSDFEYVAGINVPRLLASPLYTGSESGPLAGRIAADLATFVKYTGVDPANNISNLLIAKSRFSNAANLIIGTGRFDQKAIRRHIQSDLSPGEQKYRGIALWPIIEEQSNTKTSVQSWIAFLTSQEVALGSLASIKAFLDTRAGAKENIMAHPEIAPLIHAIPAGRMLWFAGTNASVLAKAPVPIPANNSSIRSIAGVFEITDAVTGEVAITAGNPEAAAALTNFYKKITSVGPLMEDPNAGLKLLAGGLTVSPSESQVTLSLNYPPDTLQRLWDWASPPMDALQRKALAPSQAVEVGKNVIPPGVLTARMGADPPEILFRPTPSYTDEARKERIQGSIVVQCIVRKDGTPDSFKVLKGLGYGLEESAISTIAAKWRFIPGISNGMPMNVLATIEVTFRIY